nr:Mut7-C ubiquitin/RNAse domain-containing protein [Cryobacterium tagatosivorans]
MRSFCTLRGSPARAHRAARASPEAQRAPILSRHDVEVPLVSVRVHPSLRTLLPPRDRGDHVVRDAAPTETVAHLLQVLGVPLTEVGAASVNGRRIGREALRTTLIGHSSALEVEARERPQSNSGRFLLDMHLGTLARRMRLLGLDAAYEPDGDDSSLATRSATEQRELLNRDRGLLFRKTVHDGALLRSGDVNAQLDDVLSRFAPHLAPVDAVPALRGAPRGGGRRRCRGPT